MGICVCVCVFILNYAYVLFRHSNEILVKNVNEYIFVYKDI